MGHIFKIGAKIGPISSVWHQNFLNLGLLFKSQRHVPTPNNTWEAPPPRAHNPPQSQRGSTGSIPVQAILHPTRRIAKSRHHSCQELQVNKDVSGKDWNDLQESLAQIPDSPKSAYKPHLKSQSSARPKPSPFYPTWGLTSSQPITRDNIVPA